MRQIVQSVLMSAAIAVAVSTGARAQACRTVAPPDWSSATSIRWFGPCPGGAADGLGVLRSYLNGKPGPAFYGRMAKGALDVGVVEDEGGFAAGKFVGGEPQQGGDRQTLIKAFDIAAKAARAAAAQFRAENNAGSANLYEAKAKQLERQMD